MKYSKIYLRQLILFITLIMAQSASWAFQNEPDAFRGTQWGTNLDKVDDMVVTEPPNKFGECTYQKKNDKLRIGTGIVESIRYSSLKNRFKFIFGNLPESCATPQDDEHYQRHVNDYNLKQLEKILNKCGFKITKKTSNGIISHSKLIWPLFLTPTTLGETLIIKIAKI